MKNPTRNPLSHIAARLAAAVALAALASACSNNYMGRARELDLEVRRDRLEFTEKMRDAYFILGYEYYKLAEEAKATGKSEKADDLYKRATFYTLFYRDMDRLAKDLRFAMGSGNGSAADVPSRAPVQPQGFQPITQPSDRPVTTLPPLN